MNDKFKINGTNLGTEKEMQYTLKGIEETSYYVLQKYTRPGTRLISVHLLFGIISSLHDTDCPNICIFC